MVGAVVDDDNDGAPVARFDDDDVDARAARFDDGDVDAGAGAFRFERVVGTRSIGHIKMNESAHELLTHQ